MTVYVDDMYKHAMGRFRRMKMSHMIADTQVELLGMAAIIGVDVKHIQNANHHQEHFDIAMSKRDLAIQHGAVPITLVQCSFMCVRRRVEGILGDPNEVEEWRHAHWEKTHGRPRPKQGELDV